jgi:hypothetical protein
VTTGGAEVGRETQNEFEVFADKALDELAHVFDDGVEIEDTRLEDLHATESEELTRQGGSAVGGAIDLFDFARSAVGRRQDVHQ